ncbi:50S ribosomal protein L9 [Buchnera aphidicola (Neophyllaphis podocarpi)]|uniref:50S ribosomal protein L9 n=1 Tax=Buchnera aphidicola TaxID=9 RepID=UPI0031B89F28
MQIILLEKISNLGNKGDIVKVFPGYANNFLIPSKKAVLATKKNITYFENKKLEIKKQIDQKIISSKKKVDQIKSIGMINIASKSSIDGKFFGSIGVRDIINTLQSLGIIVSKSEINLLSNTIRSVGRYEVVFNPYKNISTTFIVNAISKK